LDKWGFFCTGRVSENNTRSEFSEEQSQIYGKGKETSSLVYLLKAAEKMKQL
jgi:hypothetical protein